MTATTIRATTSPTGEGLSSGTKALLITAPLVMALGRVLLVPLDDQNWDTTMTKMAAHDARSNAGWLIAMAASGLLGATAVILARRLGRTGRTRASMFATVTTAMGWAGCAATCVAGLYLSVASKAPDRAVQVKIQDDFNNSVATGLIFLMCVLAAVGYIVLAVGLRRSSLVSRGTAVLLGLGGVTTLLTMAGPLTALLVLTAVVLAAGHTQLARNLSPGHG